MPRLTTALTTTLALALSTGLALVAHTDAAPEASVGRLSLAAAEPGSSIPGSSVPTRFRVATFNVLGFGHTMPGGDKEGRADGRTRMEWATQVVKADRTDLIGFQEFEPPQWQKFAELMPTWALWPTAKQGTQATQNTIGWDTTVWTAAQTLLYQAPYFHGTMQPRPYVQLRNNATGQLIWVLNTHNPANTFGDAQKWRDQSERIQAALVNDLRKAAPDQPVILTGDMNDREKFYCPVTFLTDLESASGGTHGDPPDGSCAPAKPTDIDWIMGTSDLSFTGYSRRYDALVKKSSDHPYISATASVASPAAQAAGVEHVVLIDLQGVPSRVVSASRTPTLARMRAADAATLNARGTVERRTALPNTVSILTARPIVRARNGHGVADTKPTTVARAAGHYVKSVFDVVHDAGATTSLYSGDLHANLLGRSWGPSHGAADTIGRDNGRRKITAGVVDKKDTVAVAAARKRLATHPTAFTFVQMAGPADAAVDTRFGSRAYLQALAGADRQVSRILQTINKNPSTKGSTMVIVTSSSTALPASSGRHAVPLIVRGPSVPHADLYKLNPQYADPGTAPSTYAGTQPIRTSMIANLVTSSLRLPTIPGSSFNDKQDLNVFVEPVAPPA